MSYLWGLIEALNEWSKSEARMVKVWSTLTITSAFISQASAFVSGVNALISRVGGRTFQARQRLGAMVALSEEGLG